MKKLFIALTLALSLACASANNMIYVASVDSSDAVETPNGTWYFFTMSIPPNSPGFYYFQTSFDAGATWHDLSIEDYSDLGHPPLVTVWVNPLIKPPYVWYRLLPISPSIAPPTRKSNPRPRR